MGRLRSSRAIATMPTTVPGPTACELCVALETDSLPKANQRQAMYPKMGQYLPRTANSIDGLRRRCASTGLRCTSNRSCRR